MPRGIGQTDLSSSAMPMTSHPPRELANDAMGDLLLDALVPGAFELEHEALFQAGELVQVGERDIFQGLGVPVIVQERVVHRERPPRAEPSIAMVPVRMVSPRNTGRRAARE